MTTIPEPGQWIRTDHDCWWSNATAEHPATCHNAPVQIDRVVKLDGITGRWRIEATRCDGTTLHVYLDADGYEAGPTPNGRHRGVEIVPAPEAVSAC